MVVREGTKPIKKAAEPQPEPMTQRKRPEEGQFQLQIDRQVKASYTTLEAAEEAGLAIKKAHPVVQVAVYDSVALVNKIIALPA